jgi:hypothetical protein
MDSPQFDGVDTHIWIDKCEAYFAMYQIHASFRVFVASLLMIGFAVHWFQSYKHSKNFQLWSSFVAAVVGGLETDMHQNQRQNGTVEEYCRTFEQLVYHIRLYEQSLSKTMLTSQFLLGLKEELRQHV